MKREAYIEQVIKADGIQSIKVTNYFEGIQMSTWLNLRSFHVFRTTGPPRSAQSYLSVECTEDHFGLTCKENPILVVDI